jgi:hypothetical protein
VERAGKFEAAGAGFEKIEHGPVGHQPDQPPAGAPFGPVIARHAIEVLPSRQLKFADARSKMVRDAVRLGARHERTNRARQSWPEAGQDVERVAQANRENAQAPMLQ